MAAALRLGDREAAARWAETGVRRRAPLGHGSAEGCRAFAEGVQAWLAGDAGRALERYAASADAFEEHRAHLPMTLARQLRAKILAARGDLPGARAELEVVLPYWRKAKATWYLGQLRAWAAERGIELTEAETAATP